MLTSNQSRRVSKTTMECVHGDFVTRLVYEDATYVSWYFIITVTVVAVFVGGRKMYTNIKKNMAQLEVIVIGAGPIGLTSALIAVQCKRVNKLTLYEELSRFEVENRGYQIAIQSVNVSLLRSFGVDFDNLEGVWRDGCFYTRVGIYLEYIIQILPLYSTDVELKFRSKFDRETGDVIDKIDGRKLVICCDGSGGMASRYLGLSDEHIQHSTGIYGAQAAIERNKHTSVPTPEKRIHNLSFDLSAYGNTSYDEECRSNFTLKIFGNSKRRCLALAIRKGDSQVARSLKTVLDKSMMRNVFLKCFNTYKLSDEASISDSFCLNNMKFSPRLYEIKISQRIENVAYISDNNLFIITEGEATRSLNFNTGLDINIGLKSVTSLQPFIEMITVAETEHSIMETLIFKMEHSDKICKDFLKFGLKEYMFL
ncbi:hypothetical protein ACF0H5_016089 [Mactra antiquata]